MTNSPISSRQEAELGLRSGCETLIGYLRELQAIHLAMNAPALTAPESEAEVVLRLRKVFFHVQAVTSWKVGTHLLHVMAPDIRAAQEQLDPLILDDLYEGDKQEASSERRERDRVLAPLSHPTPMILIHPPDLGGLKRDNVREFLRLYLLLSQLVNAYGLALGATADILGHSQQSEIIDVTKRLTEQLSYVSPEAFRPFMEEGE